MIKAVIAFMLVASPAFAGDMVTVKRSEVIAEFDGIKAAGDRMSGAAFQFGWACGQAGTPGSSASRCSWIR